MKRILLSFSVFAISLITAFAPSFASEISLLENYGTVYDLADYKGQTYLSFMEKTIKPAMDEIATEGYEVADGKTIESAYNQVDKKVQGAVRRAGKSLANVKRIADELAGTTVTLNTIPQAIAGVDRSVDRYKLATFFGLASGGGVVIKYFDGNYGYNVHYDTEEQKSGRSFGEGPTRLANDASDANYLLDLEEYAVGEAENTSEFYQTLMESLTNSDPENYSNITEEGQTLLTDFLSVYTAEQARNLMDGRISLHWDAALLEVTLLAGFHAGQDEVKLFYYDPNTGKSTFTGETLEQARCDYPSVKKQAELKDYWQFSRRVDDPKNCGRSGINVTKREFRKLGSAITSYETENNPELVNKVKEAMGLKGKRVSNLYQALSELLINSKTPKQLGKKAYAISKAWKAFLTQVTKDAQDISEEIESQ